MAEQYVVAVGMNLSHRDEERYEPGDPIDAEHVQPWMIADGVVRVVGDDDGAAEQRVARGRAALQAKE